MKRVVIGVASLAALVLLDPGCSKPRDRFDTAPSGRFEEDAGGPPDAGCPLQCSADLRSVVRSCDGDVVEVCPPALACGEGGCIDPCTAAAQAQGSVGCEFFMLPPPTNRQFARSCYAAYVVNAQPTAADLRIELGGQVLDLSGAVFTFAPGTGNITPHEGAIQPGEGVVVFLADPEDKSGARNPVACPSSVKPLTTEWPISTFTNGLSMGAAFRLVTSAPVTASTIYPFGGAKSFVPSATLLLPVAGWGKQHVLVGAWERLPAGDGAPTSVPGVQIVAAEDDTEIAIRPKVDIKDGELGGDVLRGASKGTLTTYVLARGQSLQIMQLEDPTGSVIESNKPTSVFGGHECMMIPSDVCCCDADQQQLPALEQWGHEYVVVGSRPRAGLALESSPYRIVAAFDGTELYYDPAPPGGAPRTMGAGDVATFWTAEPFVVRSQDAEHPVYVAQYMTGANLAGTQGDPEFVNVVPAGQYLTSYAFYADPTFAETSLVVVRQKRGDHFEGVTLECAGGDVPDFRPVGTDGRFEYAYVDLTRGAQPVSVLPGGPPCGHGLTRLRSNGSFSATLWGWDSYSSYAYPGGMGQRKLVTGSLVVR